MAFTVNVSLNYATHLPALMRALALTDGPVLELGMGLFSTPYLHYACLLAGRWLVSYENDAGWAEKFKGYQSPLHEIVVLPQWEHADFVERCAVALVDLSPDEQRAPAIVRLANYAQIIVAHDSNGRWDKHYHYSTIYPLFRYRADWTGDGRHAAVLSNFVNLEGFWK